MAIISVIVPVYNVFDYIDECMQSIINQTFSNFELILINDGSTDGSDIKCKLWSAADMRIKYITKKNEGLSPTRNFGIKLAEGKYITFIDSDDWVDKRFLELLYNAAESERADISECDIYRVDHNTGKKTWRHCYGAMGLEYSKEDRMKYGNTIPCKCLYKRSLWIDNNIEFPSFHSPARTIYPLLVALSNKISSVREPYYYRKFRPGSLSLQPRKNSGDEDAEGIESYKLLSRGFKQRGLYAEYKDLLESTITYKSSETLSGLFPIRTESDFRKRIEAYDEYLSQEFPRKVKISYITWGGYNLNRIMWYMNFLHRPDLRFNFSSIISVMHPVKLFSDIAHDNAYRKIMVKRDILSELWETIKREHPTHLILDFLEERFDVVQVGNGYITKSDAYDGAFVNFGGGEVIAFGNEERDTLWKSSVMEFLSRISTYLPLNHIILVKNYLSEKKGDIYSQQEFDNLEEIRRINSVLQKYYDFFVFQCPEAKVIDPSNKHLYFTDQEYEYGAIPAHLNEIVNREIAKDIEDVLVLE